MGRYRMGARIHYSLRPEDGDAIVELSLPCKISVETQTSARTASSHAKIAADPGSRAVAQEGRIMMV